MGESRSELVVVHSIDPWINKIKTAGKPTAEH